MMLKAQPSRFSTLYEPEFRKDGTLPLILISQLPRSGGTMMSQFFDGIPEILAFPRELHLGAYKTEIPDLDTWCDLSAETVRDAFMRANRGLFALAAQGRYEKGNGSYLPFFFDEHVFIYVFGRLWDESPPRSGRDICTIFFTSFFTAWIDLQTSAEVHPRYLSAFAALTACSDANVARFFAYYPDGYLIQVLREPLGWYSSIKARMLAGKGRSDLGIYRGLEQAIDAYVGQAESMSRTLKSFPDKCILLDYGDLVGNTAPVMSELCAALGIRDTRIATVPTFNSRPIGANSSFRDPRFSRERILEKHEVRLIEDGAMPAYAELRSRLHLGRNQPM